MKWLPWDHLQLDFSSGVGQQANKFDFSIIYMRGRRKKFKIDGESSSVLFIGDEDYYFTSHLAKMAGYPQSMETNVETSIFPFGENQAKFLEKISQKAKQALIHAYREPFKVFLEDLVDFQNKILESCKKSQLAEPYTKKYQLLIVSLGDAEVNQLSEDFSMQKNLKLFLDRAEELRTPLVISIDTKQRLPRKLIESFDSSVWLGENQMENCKKEFPDLNLGRIVYSRERRGTIKSKKYPFLVPAYSWEFEQSQWYEAFKKDKVTQLDTYKDFLETLEDGSESFSWRRNKKSY